MGLTRRDFLKGSALTVGAIATLGLPQLPLVADLPTEPTMVGLRSAGKEIVGLGYKRLPLPGVTQISTPRGTIWDAADVTWSTVFFMADEVVLYGEEGQELASIHISPMTGSGGDLTIVWDAKGMYEESGWAWA